MNLLKPKSKTLKPKASRLVVFLVLATLVVGLSVPAILVPQAAQAQTETKSPTLAEKGAASMAADKGSATNEATTDTTKKDATKPQVEAKDTVGWFMSLVLYAIFRPIFALEGFLLTMLTRLLLWIVKYQTFVNHPTVNLGWTLVRDVSNLFFVVILLAIALGTILRIESYNFKRLLPKMIIMAVLINFSLVIAGVIIDFAQVVMLTFVSAFAAVSGEGNIIAALKIDKIIFYKAQNTAGVESAASKTDGSILTLVVTLLTMVIMLLVAIIVLLVMLVVFTIRIVMLWLLLILSPLAYILAAFPQGMRYAQQWWGEFSKYVIVGPVLAFFLWLALAVGTSGTNDPTKASEIVAPAGSQESQPPEFDEPTGTESQGVKLATEVASPATMTHFIIVIALLVGSLVITQQLGVAGGSFAGNMVGRLRSAGMAPLRKLGQAARWSAGKTTNLIGRRLDDAQAALQSKTILPLLAKTKWGKKKGMDTLAREGGFRLRTFPEAWRRRSARVEKEMMRGGVEATTDVMNRLFISPSHRLLRGDKGQAQTEEARRKRASRVAEEQRDLSSVTTDADEIMDMLKKEDLDKGGRVKIGHEESAIAKLRQLTKDHNANEFVLQAEQVLGKDFVDGKGLGPNRRIDKDAAGNIEYTTNNVQESVRHMFGNFDENLQGEVMFDLGEVGFANKDAKLYKMAQRNLETDSYEMLTADKTSTDPTTGQTVSGLDKQRRIAQIYIAKQEGRDYIRRNTWQNFLEEVRPQDMISGGVSSTASRMSDFGKLDLRKNPKAMTAEYHQASNEIKSRMLENLDVMDMEVHQARASGDTELADNIEGLMKSVVGFQHAGRLGSEKPEANVKDFSNVFRQEIQRSKQNKIDRYGQDFYNKIHGSAAPAPAPGGPLPLGAVSEEKYQRTKELQDRAAAAGSHYTLMDEYKNNPDGYLDEAEINRHDRKQRVAPAQSYNRFGRGQSDELAVDFKRLDLDFLEGKDGVTFENLSSDQATELAIKSQGLIGGDIKKLETDMEKKRGDASMRAVQTGGNADEIYQEMTKGDRIRLENMKKAAERLNKPEELGAVSVIDSGGGREAVVHERAHRDLTKIDPEGKWATEKWNSLSEEEKTKRGKEFDQQAGRSLSDLEKAKENAAHSFSNTTRWGDQSPTAQRFKAEELKEIKAMAENQGVELEVPVSITPDLEKIPSAFFARIAGHVGQAKNAISGLIQKQVKDRKLDYDARRFIKQQGKFEKATAVARGGEAGTLDNYKQKREKRIELEKQKQQIPTNEREIKRLEAEAKEDQKSPTFEARGRRKLEKAKQLREQVEKDKKNLPKLQKQIAAAKREEGTASQANIGSEGKSIVYMDRKQERQQVEAGIDRTKAKITNGTNQANQLTSEANSIDKTTPAGRAQATEKLNQAKSIKKQVDQAKKQLKKLETKLESAKKSETEAETVALPTVQKTRLKQNIVEKNKQAAVTAQMIANAKATQVISKSPNGFAGNHLPQAELEKVQKELDGYRAEFKKARQALRQEMMRDQALEYAGKHPKQVLEQGNAHIEREIQEAKALAETAQKSGGDMTEVTSALDSIDDSIKVVSEVLGKNDQVRKVAGGSLDELKNLMNQSAQGRKVEGALDPTGEIVQRGRMVAILKGIYSELKKQGVIRGSDEPPEK